MVFSLKAKVGILKCDFDASHNFDQGELKIYETEAKTLSSYIVQISCLLNNWIFRGGSRGGAPGARAPP